MFKRFSGSPKIKNAGLVLLLILVSCGVYFNTLGNAFLWDDAKYILDHSFIKDLSNIKHIFNITYLRDPQKLLKLGMYNIARPVWVISAMIDYKMWGENPFGHHLTNIMLHCLSVVLLFLLLNLIFKNYCLSFLASLIFALHPIHTETINVVTFRPDMLAFIFMSLSFILVIKSLDAPFLKALTVIVISFIFYVVALLAKGMAVTLPVLVGLYLWLIVPRERLTRNNGAIFFYFFLIGLIVIAYLFMRQTHFFYGNADIDVPLAQKNLLYRLALMSVVMTKYISLLFLPAGLCADYLFNSTQSVSFISVIFAAILLVCIFICGVMLRRRQKIVTFSVFWFFITIFPVSNIMPMVNIIAERYLYIPSAGFCIFFAFLFLRLRKAVKKEYIRCIINLLFIFILCFYTYQTFRRNQHWKDNLTIWSKTVKQLPDNFRVRNNLGRAYAVSGRFDEAIREFKKSLEINPKGFIAHANLAGCYQKMGRLNEAKAQYRKAIQIKPGEGRAEKKLWIVLVGLGNDYLKAGRLDEALQEYLASIHLNPKFAPVYYNLGNIFLRKEMLEEAKDMYNKTIEIREDYAQAHNNLGVVFAKEGNLEMAEKQWRRALKLRPKLVSARENLEQLEKEKHKLRRQLKTNNANDSE